MLWNGGTDISPGNELSTDSKQTAISRGGRSSQTKNAEQRANESILASPSVI